MILDFSLEKFFLKWTKFFVFAVIFSVFVVWPNTAFTAVFAQDLFIRFTILFALLGYVWLIAFNRDYLPAGQSPEGSRPMAGRPNPNILFWSIIGFFAINILSAILSLSPFRSFWGEVDRMEGLFGLLHYLALFIIVISVFKKQDFWKFFKISLIVAAILWVYSLIQYINVLLISAHQSTFRGIPFIFSSGTGIDALFGNSLFYSLYLLFMSGIALLVYFHNKATQPVHGLAGRFWSVFPLILLGLFIFSIIWISGRGEIAGLTAGILTFLILFSLKNKKPIYKRIVLGFILLIIIVVAVSILFQSYFKNSRALSFMYRIGDIPRDASVYTRLISVKSSVNAWLDNPKTFFVGWGPELFIVGYNKHYAPEYATYDESWFDRAHNKLADVLVTNGILGIISYLAIFVIAFKILINWFKNQRERAGYVLALFSLLAAYFVQNLFLFDIPISYVYFFMILSFIYNESRELKDDKFAVYPSNLNKNIIPAISAVLITLGLLWVLYISLLLPVYQFYLHNKLTKKAVGEKFFNAWDKIFYPKTFANYYLLNITHDGLISSGLARNPAFDKLTFRAIEQYEEFLRQEPYNAVMHVRLSKLYLEKGLGSEEMKYMELAEKHARDALALSPARQEIHYLVAFTLQGQGKFDESIEFLKQTVALNPKAGKAHYSLGLAYAVAGRINEAVEELEISRKMGWFISYSGLSVENVIKIYARANKPDLLKEVLKNAIQRRSGESKENFNMLLSLLIKDKNKDEFILWAKKYVKIFPDFANFINPLINLAEKDEWGELSKIEFYFTGDKSQEDYLILIQRFVKERNVDETIRWMDAYKKDYPEYTTEADLVISLVRKGDWSKVDSLIFSDSANGGSINVVPQPEEYVALIRNYIKAKNLSALIKTATEYKINYPQVADDMDAIINLANSGDWDILDTL